MHLSTSSKSVRNSRHRLEPCCSAQYFVALRSQRYGVAPSSRLVSTKHSGPIRMPRVFHRPARIRVASLAGALALATDALASKIPVAMAAP
jgi:hypothetical protein